MPLGRWTPRAISVLAFAAVTVSAAAHASNLRVTYNVRDKPLKTSAIAGTPLRWQGLPSLHLGSVG
jgi:hypothetical protein